MIIQCSSCKAKFKLDEDRIKGKGVRVKCRKCSGFIIVMKPEYEHLKSQFIDSVEAKDLSKEKVEEREAVQPDTQEREEPPPPAFDKTLEAEAEKEEPAVADAPEEDAARFEIPDEITMPMEKQEETYPETGEEVSAPPSESIDEMKAEVEADKPPIDDSPKEPLPFDAPEKEEVAQEEEVSQHPLEREEEPLVSPDVEEEEEIVAEAREATEPSEEEPASVEDKDDIDMAFEKFLVSLREESQIPMDKTDPAGIDEKIRDDTAFEDDKVELTADKSHSEVERKEAKPEILSADETLEFISKEAEGETGLDEPFDLKLKDEKLDLKDSIEFSDTITTREEPIDETALREDILKESGDTLMESHGETLIQQQPESRPDALDSEPEIFDEGFEKAEEVQREKPSPYEFVPTGVVRKKKKSKVAGFLLGLLIFLIIIAGGGAYLAFTKPGNEKIIKYAPYVRSIFGIKDTTPVSQYDITNLIGYYETNRNVGKIFVIKGQVVNLSRNVNSGIILKGQLLNGGNNVLAEKTVYAGNTIDNKNLKNSSVKSIEESLQNKLGKNLANIDIQPGSAVPFMIVFFELPEKIEAYKVESVE